MNKEKELKLVLIRMMKWFHEFCSKNNLKYYAIGGTMLGAIRHNGFIPWDDDVDIGMPRKDYEKLIILLKNTEQKKYILETPKTKANDYYYPFSKLYDTDTTLIENTKYKIKRGVYLDIFPLDGVGNNFEESKKFAKKIYMLNNVLMLKTAGIRKKRSFYKNMGILLFRFIPINSKKILQNLVKKCAEKDYDKSLWIGNLTGAWQLKEVMPKEYIGTPKLYKFEDIYIFGVENADAYLTSLYGDWKQLPDKEKRITHHDFIECNLYKSYLEEDK